MARKRTAASSTPVDIALFGRNSQLSPLATHVCTIPGGWQTKMAHRVTVEGQTCVLLSPWSGYLSGYQERLSFTHRSPHPSLPSSTILCTFTHTLTLTLTSISLHLIIITFSLCISIVFTSLVLWPQSVSRESSS